MWSEIGSKIDKNASKNSVQRHSVPYSRITLNLNAPTIPISMACSPLVTGPMQSGGGPAMLTPVDSCLSTVSSLLQTVL